MRIDFLYILDGSVHLLSRLFQLKSMEGKHKSAVGEVAHHLEQCRKIQKALGESEEKRAVAEKSGKLSETTLETIRSVKFNVVALS